ncbi:MAG TPA: hypothetical protein VNT54_00190 [Solirubrobacteraceae bacterium]|nr:hypothetical protein [Solirubrobacteraceae bacterium]
MSDAYCRRCHATFARPLPAPYGAICPNCMARGDIVTLTDIPRARLAARPRDRGDGASQQGRPRQERATKRAR